MPEPEYLSVRQVADRFDKSPSWVIRRIKDGRLPASNINTPEFPRYAWDGERLKTRGDVRRLLWYLESELIP